MDLRDQLTNIKGIGDKTALLFAKLGIRNVGELINTFPRDYIFYGEPVDIDKTKIGSRNVVEAIVYSYVEVKRIRSLTLVTMTVKDSSGSMRVTWFNQQYLRNAFHKGDTYVFVGEIKIKNNMRVMEQPEYYKPVVYENMRQELQPVYPLTKGLSNKTFQKAVKASRSAYLEMRDYIPDVVKNEYNLMDITESYENIHFPMNEKLLKNAIRRMAFDEFYKFLYELTKLKEENVILSNTHKVVQGKAVSDFISSLPYKLTKGQAQAIDDVLSDMGGSGVMNRLIQGDVGSGKTVVAAAALLACAKEGYQCAFMVPTEVLAKQHYETLTELFEDTGLNIGCLVGSTPMKEKRDIYERIKSDEIDIIIGTHALIEDKVEFYNLGLVITDEQHRFGVSQRELLSQKGDSPHILVMSATPIPRTLAIIMYSDLDISVIKELPKGRKPIKNCVVGTNYRNTAYKFIAGQVAEQSQVYVICPMVNTSDSLDVSNVVEYTDTLKEALPANVRVETLYGQMKADEKNDIMQKFMNKEIDVLVSTTVIEVGINNPNATVMMVENSERFGLAQLHQLRGRVGRGEKQSYCIFINGNEDDEEVTERLKVLEESNDGFFIAGEDLRLRGPGDFFGIRQSGDVQFNIADIYNHADMLRLAQEVLGRYKDKVIPDSSREIKQINL
ncbi:MAG: ATP-dependent DNA helicase RecG [Lachnospiraceae bacterium]|nr:ATP-dependent DNA helicase RecG [Lachnospiraceae bacterium]